MITKNHLQLLLLQAKLWLVDNRQGFKSLTEIKGGPNIIKFIVATIYLKASNYNVYSYTYDSIYLFIFWAAPKWIELLQILIYFKTFQFNII